VECKKDKGSVSSSLAESALIITMQTNVLTHGTRSFLFLGLNSPNICPISPTMNRAKTTAFPLSWQ
jgi:hypothetical protein